VGAAVPGLSTLLLLPFDPKEDAPTQAGAPLSPRGQRCSGRIRESQGQPCPATADHVPGPARASGRAGRRVRQEMEESPMKRMGSTLFLAASAVALAAFLNVGQADAHTCSSLCNQMRRACNAEVKAAKKVAVATCGEERDACRTACETDSNSCVVDCPAEHAACIATCVGDPDCEAACDAALAACPDDCVGCCNYHRASCRADAKLVQKDLRLACEDGRATCEGTCVDPIDGACVRDCKAVQHSCQKDAKKNYWSPCKSNCPTGTERRACMRGCRTRVNQEFQLCSGAEVGCLSTCISAAP
jgi:hypothetical protein